MQTFAMMILMCPGNVDARFTFTAENQEQADDAAYRWAKYQGFDVRDVSARPAQGNELNWKTSNEDLA